MLKVIEKNILDVEEGVIAHQVNAQGVFGAGLAKQIKDKWPVVFEKYALHITHWNMCMLQKYLVGTYCLVDINPKLQVLNIIGQNKYGTNRQYTEYDKVNLAFQIYKTTKFFNEPTKDPTRQLYVPYFMGCGLAGGNWDTYSAIIEKYFPNAIVCKLPGTNK